MSQGDLDLIQTKLKLAIQNHQTLVSKLKSDPKNQIMKNKLRELQVEIMHLSERQKLAVQNLRKEIVQKQPVTKSINTGVQQYVSIAPQPVNINTGTTTLLNTTTTPVNFVTIPTAHIQKTLPQPVVSSNCSVNDLKLNQQKINNNNIINRSSSPPIRVPHYQMNNKSSLIIQNKVQCNDKNNRVTDKPNSNEMKKPFDKKPVNLEEKLKIQFMAALDLVTPETLKELQCKRTERKRRSTANPQFSYIEPEKRQRVAGYMINNIPTIVKRGRGRPPKYGTSPTNSRPNTPTTPHSTVDTGVLDHIPSLNNNQNIIPHSTVDTGVLDHIPSLNDNNQNIIPHSTVDTGVLDHIPSLNNNNQNIIPHSTVDTGVLDHTPSLNNNNQNIIPHSTVDTGVLDHTPSLNNNNQNIIPHSTVDTGVLDHIPSLNNNNQTEDYSCAVCKGRGQVLQCNSCYKVYHMKCLEPPLSYVPTGYWCCTACQTNGTVLSLNGNESMALVNSYIATKTVKEEEKRKLQRRTTDLLNERELLKAKSKELDENLTSKLKCNQELEEHNKQTKRKVESLSSFLQRFTPSMLCEKDG
ncbi:hypothetical protein LOTGIDRAFT_233351 [Lottia gigantea]|uniref:PHD-type domain-containing protein n=1 Tax=Lottia gigantea TaxID=225164 RepID=V4AEJ9_LOTGI|nr:hypothetical protein LOTGIDRAFT_233351 [Lottia gigantea]ESO91776.1 hypothetical protein LOTGIDRAFT_233351 [Lottia gigantea]